MPARNCKAQFGLAIKIFSVEIFILNNSAICQVNMNRTISKCTSKFHPEKCATHMVTMKMSSRYHNLLIYDVKRRPTNIDGMGPFNIQFLVCSQAKKENSFYIS